jgi:hypothetical protein
VDRTFVSLMPVLIPVHTSDGHFHVSAHKAFPPAVQWKEVQLQRGHGGSAFV